MIIYFYICIILRNTLHLNFISYLSCGLLFEKIVRLFLSRN